MNTKDLIRLAEFFADELRAPLPRAIYRPAFTPRAELAPWRQWGEGIEARGRAADGQCVRAAGCGGGRTHADAHVGYGLPIGGVLATDNAVIPYAVGVDIACRMKLTVFDRKANTIAGLRDIFQNIPNTKTTAKGEPNETMSRVKPGYFTDFNTFFTCSSEIDVDQGNRPALDVNRR